MEAFRQAAPPDPVADAARALGRRGGRPRGSFSPLGAWLRGVIREMRRAGLGCADTFRRLRVVEDHGAEALSFVVSAETADEIWQDVGADIAGQIVTFAQFKKIWQRTS